MQLTENFSLKELVHPELLRILGNRAASALNPLLLTSLQALRDEFGPIVVNGTYKGRTFVDSGLRQPHDMQYAKYSAHKFGFAADCKFKDVDPIQVQKHILEHPNDYPYIIRLENAEITKTWLHVEAGVREGEIIVFNP